VTFRGASQISQPSVGKQIHTKSSNSDVNAGASSSTAARILTAAVLIPAVAAVVWWGPTALVGVVGGLVAVLALREFFVLGARLNLHAYRLWSCICAMGIFFQQWAASAGERLVIRREGFFTDVVITERLSAIYRLPLELVLFVFVLGCAAIIFGSRRPLAEALGDIGISAAALLFIALPLSAVVRIHGLGRVGPKLLLFALLLVWVGDTLAYFVGRSFGRMPMAAQLSPKKTWEGAAANLLGSAIVGVALYRWLDLEPFQAVFMACLANIAGQAGDLLKSAYKRGAGVKDSGTLLPGHGGVLDRIDALILAAPVVWYYFRFVVAGRF
jgi:phosphatidate cytidylyltransferase